MIFRLQQHKHLTIDISKRCNILILSLRHTVTGTVQFTHTHQYTEQVAQLSQTDRAAG